MDKLRAMVGTSYTYERSKNKKESLKVSKAVHLDCTVSIQEMLAVREKVGTGFPVYIQ